MKQAIQSYGGVKVLLLVIFFMLPGCQTPNRGVDPETGAPIGDSQWTKDQEGTFVVSKDWWSTMGDPILDGLIAEAVTNNLDLALLLDRTRRAEIELTGAKADQWPKLNASAGYTAISAENFDTSGYSVGAGLGWELDIWGRLSEKKESELLEYRATEADWRAGYLQVVGGISRTYVFIRQLDEQRRLHQETRELAQELIHLFEIRQEAGIATSDEIAKQRAELYRLNSQLEEMDSRRKLLLNQLALLLGKEPGTVLLEPAELQSTLQLVEMPTDIEANLLTRRPDLVAAELRVKGAYRMQESMRAARWPQVTIGVSAATDPASFLSSQWTALISPKISFPVLDPQTKVRLKLSEVDLESAQKQYQQAVLKAVDEVASALVELTRYHAQKELEQKRFLEYESMRDAVRIRIEAGIDSKVDLMGAELDLIAIQQRQLDVYAEVLLSQIEVHNALGGGW